MTGSSRYRTTEFLAPDAVPPPAPDPGITFIGHGSVPGNAVDLSGLNGRSICPGVKKVLGT